MTWVYYKVAFHQRCIDYKATWFSPNFQNQTFHLRVYFETGRRLVAAQNLAETLIFRPDFEQDRGNGTPAYLFSHLQFT